MIRWREERGRATGAHYWIGRTSYGTFAIDATSRGFALEFASATQPAGTQSLGTFPTMAGAKGAAESYVAPMRRERRDPSRGRRRGGPMSPYLGRERGMTNLRKEAQVRELLTKPLPPEGAFIAGPWGWGLSRKDAAALMRRHRRILRIHGLTAHEVAHHIFDAHTRQHGEQLRLRGRRFR